MYPLTKLSLNYRTLTNAKGRAAPVTLVNRIGCAPSVLITRPSNVTAYGAGQCVGAADTVTPANAGSAILKFANAGNPGGVVGVIGAELMLYTPTKPTGMGGFTLQLYSKQPTARLDGAAWTLVDGDRDSYCGSVYLGVPEDEGGSLFVQSGPRDIDKQVKLEDGAVDLYAQLVTDDGWTPTSALQILLRLQLQVRS